MSEFQDRLDSIRSRRDKTIESLGNDNLINSLPELHRDCYWLLDVVESLLDDQQQRIDDEPV